MHALTRSMGNLNAQTKRAADAQIEKGKALTSIGVGVAAVGVAGVGMMYKFTQASAKYNQESAKTLTQVDKQKISLLDIKKVGYEVAKAIPAPFEAMQTSLYDIFSSMDVNLSGAKTLLTQFSKAAVAGQVDLQDASRATIGILNAYKMKATDVNKVNDVMFQLVRKGVGTYGEFANTIGRSVPSAVRAGQSIEDLAGMMAFLTRNGLSAAMATASAGRALDAISNPKSINNFKGIGHNIADLIGDKATARWKRLGVNVRGLGVDIVDASGKFRPMTAIMTDLGRIFEKLGLKAPEIATIMQDMFKGAGGTIQARRFFDTAVKGYRDLNKLTASMKGSAGEMDKAYNIMFKQPQSQIQLLKNNWDILKVQMGEGMLPALNKLVHGFTALFKWFNDLSPSTKKWIGYITLLISVLTIIAGVIIIAAGALFIMAGAAAALDVGLLPLILIIMAVVAAIALIAFAVYEVIKHWSGISGFFITIWNAVYGAVATAFSKIWAFIKAAWNIIAAIFTTAFTIISTVLRIGLAIFLVPWILTFNIIKGILTLFWKWAGGYIMAALKFIYDFLKPYLDLWLSAFRLVWDAIKAVVRFGWNYIKGQFEVFAKVTTTIWRGLWYGIKTISLTIFNLIRRHVTDFWSALKAGFKAGTGAITAIWNTIKKPMAGPVNFIIEWVWNKGIAKAWNTAASLVGLGKYKVNANLAPIKAASGGRIRGPGGERGDKIPALLSNNEYVVNAKSTRKYLPLIHAINQGKLPGFAGGGLLGNIGGFFGKLKNWVLDMGPAYLINKMKDMYGGVKNLGNGNWGDMISHIPAAMIDKLVAPALRKLDALWGGGGGKIVQVAKSQLGQGEMPAGSNNTKYGKWYGINPAAWCAMFVSWCADKAGVRRKYPHYASVPSGRNWFSNRGKLGGGSPRPGDVAFFDGTHTGLVVGPGWRTIEGNHSSYVQYVSRGPGSYTIGHVAGSNALDNLPGSAAGLAKGGLASLRDYHFRPKSRDVGSGFERMGISPLQVLQGMQTANSLASAFWPVGSSVTLNAGGKSVSAIVKNFGETTQRLQRDQGNPLAVGSNLMQALGGAKSAHWRINRLGNRMPAGVHMGTYDNGGYLRPGLNLAYNGTGRYERVQNPHGSTPTGGGVNQTFFINTQEINPRKHAADLGWEIARRVD
jgi:TP901 family phage tail tape measure protein